MLASVACEFVSPRLLASNAPTHPPPVPPCNFSRTTAHEPAGTCLENLQAAHVVGSAGCLALGLASHTAGGNGSVESSVSGVGS